MAHKFFSLLALGTSAVLLTAGVARSEPGNYPHAVGYVLGQIQYVKWMGDLCSERFPEMAARNTAAYADWKSHHIAFINEMEGQFDVIRRQRKALSLSEADVKSFLQEMNAFFESQKQSLKRQNESRGEAAYRRMCELYPERVATKTNNLETALAAQVAVVRQGPNPK